MCSCKNKVGSMKKGKKITLSAEDVLIATGGFLGGFLINGVFNKALESMDPQVQDTAGKIVPFAKIGLGVFGATNKKSSRALKLASVGFAGSGALEVGMKFMPEQFKIQGIGGGDLFPMLGTSTVEFPIAPSTQLEDEKMFQEEAVLGVEDDLLVL